MKGMVNCRRLLRSPHSVDHHWTSNGEVREAASILLQDPAAWTVAFCSENASFTTCCQVCFTINHQILAISYIYLIFSAGYDISELNQLAMMDPAGSLQEHLHSLNRTWFLGSSHKSERSPQIHKANATFIMLAHNDEIWKALTSIQSVEDRFNSKRGYPWVFLNDVPFSEEFIRRTRSAVSGDAMYDVIPREQWHQPDSIDEAQAALRRIRMKVFKVAYADSVQYRNQCRFNSGFFHRHPLLQPFKYYWRVEPGAEYSCDINEDPFLLMQGNNKTYGFTLSATDPKTPHAALSLWKSVKDFTDEYPQYLAPNNSASFLTQSEGRYWNLCRFRSDFEIGDMDFFRGPAYSSFFEYLDATGNFYYERWDDASVHTMAAALLLDRNQLHLFDNVGYSYDGAQRCPHGTSHEAGKCSCNPADSSVPESASCLRNWDSTFE